MIGARAASRQKRNSFTSTWYTGSAGVSPGDSIKLPLRGDGFYNCKVYWGDGTSDYITVYNQSEVTHQYPETGSYEVRIGGGITGFWFGGGNDDVKIRSITNWGPLTINYAYRAFYGCGSMRLIATDAPVITVNNIQGLFRDCYSLGSGGDASHWDVSNVTNFYNTFYNAQRFDQSLSGWDTSNATDMRGMFYGRNTTYLYFNQDIGHFNTSKVTDMNSMFYAYLAEHLFDNGGSPSISGWDTSKVTKMNSMFNGCINFNQPIGTWETSGVTDMSYMFANTYKFNQDIGNWNVSNVTNMDSMFYSWSNGVFNNGDSPSISGWDTGKLQNMRRMFFKNKKFNQPIGTWNTSSVTNMADLFRESKFNQPLSGWDTSSVTDMSFMFYSRNVGQSGLFDQDIGSWDVSNVTTMAGMFECYLDDHLFNNGGSPSISGWNTSKVQDMSSMFQRAYRFNQPIGAWDTSSLTNINVMFEDADAFNQDLSNWIVTGVTTATNFLRNNSISTTNYDRTLSGWAQQSGDLQPNVSIHFGNSKYSIATGQFWRDILTTPTGSGGPGWTITDGGSI